MAKFFEIGHDMANLATLVLKHRGYRDAGVRASAVNANVT